MANKGAHQEAWDKIYSYIVEAGDKSFCNVRAAVLYDHEFLPIISSGKPSLDPTAFGVEMCAATKARPKIWVPMSRDGAIFPHQRYCFYSWQLNLKRPQSSDPEEFILVVETPYIPNGMGVFYNYMTNQTLNKVAKTLEASFLVV